MSLKHQITSPPNNGFTGEVRERGKHGHSSAICGAADEVLWFLAEFENIVLWKTDGPLPPTHSLFLPPPVLTLSQTQTHTHTHTHTLTRYNRWSWSLEQAGKGELVMNTSSILMAWENAGRCQAPVKHNMDFHFKQAVCCEWAGVGGRGSRRGWPHTWQGPAWAVVRCLFTVSDSNRDPLKDKRSCVSQPGQLASGWSAVLFNDPHRGQGRGTWGDTQEIPGFVSSSVWESWLIQEVQRSAWN